MRLSTRFFIIALVVSSYTYSNDAKKAWDSPEMGSRELSENAWVELEKYRLEREAHIEERRISGQAQVAIQKEKHWHFWDVCAASVLSGIVTSIVYMVASGIKKK